MKNPVPPSATYLKVASAAVDPFDKKYVDEKKESKKAIDVDIRVRFKGIGRPVCVSCEHSLMSHGELNGRLFCWGCVAVRKVCNADVDFTVRQLIQEVINELKEKDSKPTQGHCVK